MMKEYFSQEQINQLDSHHIPQHIAVIPDGNRRWAMERCGDHSLGHQQGCDTLLDIVKAASELGIRTLTLFSFSTENWQRPQDEVDFLMMLLENYVVDQRQAMIDHGIRLETIGDLTPVPSSVKEQLEATKKATQHCKKIDLVLAVNYGARNEITRAVKRLLRDCHEKKLEETHIDEKMISHYLDTSSWVDPDLLIRTSGELRISNFLLWQLSYAELYFPDVLWPDFTPNHLLEAVMKYQQRTRRIGE